MKTIRIIKKYSNSKLKLKEIINDYLKERNI